MPPVVIEGAKGEYEFELHNRLNDERAGMAGALFWGNKRSEGAAHIGSRVCIKLLRFETANNPVSLARIQNVVNINVKHPNVLAVLDYCERVDLNGTTNHFLVMEFLEGENVADWFNSYFQKSSQPPPVQEVVRIAKQVLEGLRALHNRDIVHRDSEPSNWMLIGKGEDRQVKIIDLDVAYSPRSINPTNKGARIGKLQYMPPEQIDGNLTPAPNWDLYALAISMYQLITSRLPFAMGEEAPTVHAIRFDRLPKHSKLTPKMYRLLEKATAKQPEQRFQTAEAFLDALLKIEQPKPISPISLPSWISRFFKWFDFSSVTLPKFDWAKGLKGLVVLALLVVAWQVFWYTTAPPEPVAKIQISGQNGCQYPCSIVLDGSKSEHAKFYKWLDENGNTIHEGVTFSYDGIGRKEITLTTANEVTDKIVLEIRPPQVSFYVIPRSTPCVAPCSVEVKNSNEGVPENELSWLADGAVIPTVQRKKIAVFTFKEPGRYKIKNSILPKGGETYETEKEVIVESDSPIEVPPKPQNAPPSVSEDLKTMITAKGYSFEKVTLFSPGIWAVVVRDKDGKSNSNCVVEVPAGGRITPSNCQCFQ
jgi:serine/threonine-protein kinase